MSTELRFFNPTGPDRVAVISVEDATTPGMHLVRLARGKKSTFLSGGASYGPYREEDVPDRVAELEVQLVQEGFVPSGEHSLLEDLASDSASIRAGAARRMGWHGRSEYLEPLLKALESAGSDACTILDALGALGDPRAVDAIRPFAERKLLSRRRSAVEALIQIGDDKGLAAARERVLAAIPESVRDVIEALDEGEPGKENIVALSNAVKDVEAKRHGLICDFLYELCTPVCVGACRRVVRQMPFDQPFVWRYVKSIFKRSMLRRDYRTFGWLSHAIERQARDSAGTHATVKSGLDGKSREMVIFGRKTQNYMRRASWRFLRKVARHRSAEYPHAAAEVLVQYGPEDEEMPVGKYGAFNRCYLLMRILYGASQRFLVSSRSLRFKLASSGSAEKPEGLREEAFADLWDEEPRAFLRILSAAKLAEAHEFALAGIKRHPETIQDASPKELLAMLKAPHPETIELSLHEIEDRFDPGDPDWDLIALLMTSDHPTARKLGERFLQQSSPIWTGQAPLIIRFLTLSDGVARSYAANILIAAPPVTDTKSALAEIFWEMLKRDIPEGSEDDLESVARVCRELLLNELSGRTDTSELLSLISKGSASAQSVAADLLAMRPEAAGALGLERLASLAVHSLAAVRGAAAKLLRAAGSYLDADPSILFVMVECDWEDTRAAALELIREKIDFADAERGFDSLVGLLDSNIVDVQEFAKQLVYDHLETIDRTKLVYRLAQHPHPNIRRFALKLAVEHLPDGAAPLRRVESLCRSALFDLWPLREEKRGVIDFLTQRGMTDQSQALIASRILSEIIPTQGRADFESAMDAIVRMKLAYPDLESCVTFHEMEAS